jgi:hypothetical protein
VQPAEAQPVQRRVSAQAPAPQAVPPAPQERRAPTPTVSSERQPEPKPRRAKEPELVPDRAPHELSTERPRRLFGNRRGDAAHMPENSKKDSEE